MTTTALSPKAIVNVRTIAAIIRKDLRSLWPFALILALVQLVMAAFFHVREDYPEVILDLGRSQLHFGAMMLLFHAIGLPIVVATFIVLLVHQDPATDARNDWMARPIWALDIVAAKALVILAVVLAPSAIGNFAYVLMHDNLPIEFATGPIMFTLMGCMFMLVVAWLGSSTVQALLAPLVLAIVTLLTILALGLPLSMGIADIGAQMRDRQQAIEIPAIEPETRAAPDSARPTVEAPLRLDSQDRTNRSDGPVTFSVERRLSPAIDLTWTLVIVEFALALAGSGVVLWLLLVRRRLATARLAFLGFFAAAILFMLFGGSIVAPRDEMIGFVELTMPASAPRRAPEPQRLAAFANNDRNRDGRLDRTEYNALLDQLGFSGQLETLWPQRDRNRDGFVSIEEYKDPF